MAPRLSTLAISASLLFAPPIVSMAKAEDAVGSSATPSIRFTPVSEIIGAYRDAAFQESLNELYDELSRDPDPKSARRTARAITQKLQYSGSDTIDLLMLRAGEAMEKRNNGAALDVLDQVIALAPDYAEGWNRRATLYFMMKDFGRSIADVEQVLKLEPRHFGALSGLATMLKAMKRDARALEVWYRLLEVYPANEQAQKAVIDLEEDLSGEPT